MDKATIKLTALAKTKIEAMNVEHLGHIVN